MSCDDRGFGLSLGLLPFTRARRLSQHVIQRYHMYSVDTTVDKQTLRSASILGGACVTGPTVWLPGMQQEYTPWFPGNVAKVFNALERRGLDADHVGTKPGAVLTLSPFQSPLYKIFIQACAEAGMDVDALSREGFLASPRVGVVGRASVRVTPNGEAASTHLLWLDRALADPTVSRHLTVATDTRAVRLHLSGATAQGVAVVTKNGEAVTVPCGRVVLCAGALESPRLLQLSGIGAPEALKAAGISCVVANADVGANLHDQVDSPVSARLTSQDCIAYLAASSPAVQLGIRAEWEMRREGWGMSDFTDVVALVKSTKCEGLVPDMALNFLPFGSDNSQPQCSIVARVATPTSRGSVSLQSSDVMVPSRIDLGHLMTETDKQVMAEAVAMATQILGSKPFGSRLLGSSLLDGPPLSASQCGGTCALDKVVDGVSFKVKGTDNMYVCDSSVVPRPLLGGLGPAVVMLASQFGKVSTNTNTA